MAHHRSISIVKNKKNPTSTCELSAPARSFSQPWNVIMSTLVFPSTSLLVLHGTVVALQENRFLEMPYISKYSLNAPQHSSPPGTKTMLSWEPSKIQVDFCLDKNQIREINIWFLPPHCLVLLSIDALSPQKGTYIIHFVSQVLRKKNVPFQSSYFSPCLLCR